MRYVLWLAVTATIIGGCRGAPLVAAEPGLSARPVAAADTAPPARRPSSVFEGLLETGETKSFFSFDMDSVVQRVLEDRKRRELGSATASEGRITFGWGSCR